MKRYQTEVFINGERRCAHIRDTRERALESAKDTVAWMLKDEAAIAHTLKIRDRTVAEIRLDGKAIRR